MAQAILLDLKLKSVINQFYTFTMDELKVDWTTKCFVIVFLLRNSIFNKNRYTLRRILKLQLSDSGVAISPLVNTVHCGIGTSYMKAFVTITWPLVAVTFCSISTKMQPREDVPLPVLSSHADVSFGKSDLWMATWEQVLLKCCLWYWTLDTIRKGFYPS